MPLSRHAFGIRLTARRTALAEVLLDAGVEILQQEGLKIGASDLTFQRVLDHIEATQGRKISPGSVYDRLWIGVADFQIDVLARAAAHTPSIEETWADNDDEIGSVLGDADLETPAGRNQLIKELARRVGLRYERSTDESDTWGLWTAIWALYALDARQSTIPDIERVGETLRQAYRDGLRHYLERYQALQDLAGLEPMPDLVPDPEQALPLLAQLLNALAEGVSLRRTFTTEEQGDRIQLATGPDGELEDWELFGLGAFAIVRGLFRHQDTGAFIGDGLDQSR